MKLKWLLILCLLLNGCATLRRKILYEPGVACVEQYMRERLGFSGPHAARVAIGDDFYCYTSDWRLGSRAIIVCPNEGPPACPKLKRRNR